MANGDTFRDGTESTTSLLRVVRCDVKELDIGLIMIILHLNTAARDSVDQTHSTVYRVRMS